MPLSGRPVDRVDVSRLVPKLRLEFWNHGHGAEKDRSPGPLEYHLIIEGPFTLASSDGSVNVDPETGPDPTYLRLVDKTVLRARAFGDGGLRVEFVDGDVLSVSPHRHEPWQLEPVDGAGMRVVSVAGGGLAVWHEP